jgi:Zn-dependent protease
MLGLDPQQLVARIVVVAVFLLVAFPVHEFAHAWAAFRLGDSTARYFGRLTLDPVTHFDPIGGLLLAASVILSGGGFGWAKPTPVNPMNLRGRYGEAIVSAAGPISNLLLAVVGGMIFRAMVLANVDSPFFLEVVFDFVRINLLLMIFNFIPVPPLDGSRVLYVFLDPRTERQVRPVLDQYGIFILFAIAFFPLANGNSVLSLIFGPIFNPLLRLLIGVG